jgi:hypothetical protein
MRVRPVLSVLAWPLVLIALAGFWALAYQIHNHIRHQRTAEAGDSAPPKRAANAIIKLGAALAESHGLTDEAARAVQWTKRVAAYGRVVPNPRGLSEVRVAFAGTLRSTSDTPWPLLGARVKAGQVLGWLDIRVGPQERLDLLTRLNEARFKERGSEELVRLQQERVDRFRAAGAGVSQAELDSALTQLTEARTQLATARAAVKEWQDALTAIDQHAQRKATTWSQPLTAPADGEITELAGRPGMTVEPGGVVARCVDFRFALLRLEVPPEVVADGPPAHVELFANSAVPLALEGATNNPDPRSESPSFPGRLVGAAPQVEVNSQFAAYWYEVDTAGGKANEDRLRPSNWRPGLFVKALVPVPQAGSRSAVAVPATSLLYHQGRALVYVRISPGRFERREVRILGRDNGSWVLASGVQAGERVVSQRAQVLLSEEFRGEADND